MKKLLLALLLATATLSCSKSNDDDDSHISASQVPPSVMSAFNTKYPTASGEIQWEIEHGNEYKVKFFIGPQRWEARFDSKGNFISEEKKN